jgi:hypothetical protein
MAGLYSRMRARNRRKDPIRECQATGSIHVVLGSL